MWRPLKTKANKKDKDELRMREGYFLGIIHRTDEAIIGTSEGAVRCREVRRLPREDQGDAEGLFSCVGWPSAPVPGRKSATIPSSTHMEEDGGDEEVEAEYATADVDIKTPDIAPPHVEGMHHSGRELRILRKDVAKYGYSQGCPACRDIKERGAIRAGVQHNFKCRERMTEELLKDDTGKLRIAEYRDRVENRKKAVINPDVPAVTHSSTRNAATGSGITPEERQEQLKRHSDRSLDAKEESDAKRRATEASDTEKDKRRVREQEEVVEEKRRKVQGLTTVERDVEREISVA